MNLFIKKQDVQGVHLVQILSGIKMQTSLPSMHLS